MGGDRADTDGCVPGRQGSGWQQCLSSGDALEGFIAAEVVWDQERPFSWRTRSTIGSRLKVFIGLLFGDPSPDHSVISRFRDRVRAKAMERVHAELPAQLSLPVLEVL